MPHEFNHLGEDERLKAENDFLKMKLMLEHGGHFVGSEVPEDVENDFLKNIIAFEKEFANRKTIRVFDKIGRPHQFKPSTEVPDDDIDKAWQQLRELLYEHNIGLGVCSPNITVRELYRFVVEELFEYEMDDMEIPGLISHFIYDEFHPDPVYDNSRLVLDELLGDIFSDRELFYEVNYDGSGFIFNDQHFHDYAVYREKINRFKSLYQEIELKHCAVDECVVNGKHCVVKGSYSAAARDGRNEDLYEGKFGVELVLKEFDYWHFNVIRLEGFNP